ncbi:MAG: hypothetical protein AAF737_05090 [Pseudomonadota bacterium]
MKRAFLLLLFAFSTSAFAQEQLTGPEIETALSGNTTIATGTTGTPWRQFFAGDGTTRYYSGSQPASLGEWRVQGDEYCSLWPPARTWDCYTVLRSDQIIIWLRDGAEPDSSILYDGDQTLGALPPGHPK